MLVTSLAPPTLEPRFPRLAGVGWAAVSPSSADFSGDLDAFRFPRAPLATGSVLASSLGSSGTCGNALFDALPFGGAFATGGSATFLATGADLRLRPCEVAGSAAGASGSFAGADFRLEALPTLVATGSGATSGLEATSGFDAGFDFRERDATTGSGSGSVFSGTLALRDRLALVGAAASSALTGSAVVRTL